MVPSDDNGDVGPGHFVQIVNASYQVFDKTGVSLLGPINNNTLWQGFGGPCETTNNGDPIVLYDPIADRWMLSQFALPNGGGCNMTSYQCVAVSTSGDPTGSYFRYAYFLGSNDFYDYPKFGVWPDAYYMSANVDPGCAGGAVSAIGFDRAKMLVGDPSAYMQEVRPNAWPLMPADFDGTELPPLGSTGVFINFSSTNFLELYRFDVDWDEPANSTFTGPTALTTAPFDYNVCAAGRWQCVDQPNTTTKLEALSGQVMNRVTYRNFDTHDSLVLNHTVRAGTSQAALRWYELRNLFAIPTIYQQGTYAPDATHRWTGGINIDRAGDIGVAYNVSSGSVFPGIRYTGRLATDPLGTLPLGEATLQNGGGSEAGSNRWGDYASMSVDPTDQCTFWYTSQYMPNSIANNWRTRIGAFKIPQCAAASCGPGADYVITSTVGTFTYASTLLPGSQCDDCVVNVPLPFPVKFDDVTYDSVGAGANGNLQFGSVASEWNNVCLPHAGFNNTIFAYWDDLDMRPEVCQTCGIYTEVEGTAPNRTFLIEWFACPRGSCNQTVSFEVRMYEGQDKYDIIYGPLMTANGSSATIGVQQGNGISVTQFECNTRTISPGLLLRLQPRACRCDNNGDFVITEAGGATALSGDTLVPGSQCDDCVVPVPLPFPVRFYGSAFTLVNAGANGNLQFNSNGVYFNNTCLPAGSFNNTIFAYWDDLDMRPAACPTCGIYTSVLRTAPDRIFNVEYRACQRTDSGACGGYVNFHIYLYEGTLEKFEIIYSSVDASGGLDATVGVQRGTGEQFTQHECNAGGISGGLKLIFRRTVCNVPTPTPTFTPSPSPTHTPTYTPVPTCGPDADYEVIAFAGATITPGTTDIGLHCLDCVTTVPLDFPVHFYGNTYNFVNVSSKGNLQFVSNSSAFNNTCLPAPVFNDTILGYWDDLTTDCVACGVYTAVTGPVGNRVLIFEWRSEAFGSGTYVNFEILIFEAERRFDIIYAWVDSNGSSATIGLQRGTGGQFSQFSCNTTGVDYGIRVNFRQPSCATNTPTRTPTVLPATNTPTRTPSSTPASGLVGHVVWQGPLAQPHIRQQLPITLTLKLGATEQNYPSQNTDASGFFTVSVTGLPNGLYNWRVKGPRYLASAGSVSLTGAVQTNVEMGLQVTGDANNNNSVSSTDFNILRTAFGGTSDLRADFNNDGIVNSVDFNLLRASFGLGGAPPIGPSGR
jgi:hypothetical protein